MSRNLLAPPLIRMGDNRCYRVNLVHEDFGGSNPIATEQKQQYVEEDLYEDDHNLEDQADLDDIEELPNGLYQLKMHVAQSFYGGLIGFKGNTKRRIETETHTELFIPKNKDARINNKNSDFVTIKGKAQSAILAAKRRIETLIISLRKNMKKTHFVGIPLNFGVIKENFIALREKILSSQLTGIDESLFISDDRIHLTIATCVLLDDVERQHAVELLETCREFLNDLKTPFDVKITGLEIMNDDPSAVRVLYARIDAPQLQIFANRVVKLFEDSGLSGGNIREDTVKLHMTVMNSRYGETDKQSNSFDAREIFKRFADHNFGNTQCNELRLCVISRKDELKSKEFYKTTGVINF